MGVNAMGFRVLGIDPGTGRLGFGVLEQGSAITFVDCGLIHPEASERGERLSIIHAEILRLIQRYRPDLVAIERLFFNKNVRTAMTVGEAIGVILLAAKQAKVPVREYTPMQVKEAVAGSGKARKQEVKGMLEILLDLKIKGPDDVADALGVAYCHLSSEWLNGDAARG